MITLEEAQKYLLDNAKKSSIETIRINDALNRVLAENIYSSFENPPFNRSPLDGYAVMGEDLNGASKENGIKLEVIDKIYAGHVSSKTVTSKTAVRLMTGAPIPEGANCVVRQEDTEEKNGHVTIFKEHKPYENFCYAGEDFKKGTKVLEENQLLNSSKIMALAAIGIDEVKVYKKPIVGIITTGDEIQNPGTVLNPGKIYNSNGYFLYARLLELGAEPIIFDLAEDTEECIIQAINNAEKQCDIIITTGGVSVGEKDLVKACAKEAGYELLFWKIDIKPGSPMFGAKKGDKILVGLSGTPVAAATTFELTVRPFLSKVLSCEDINLKQVNAIMEDNFSKVTKKRRFLRVKLEQKYGDKVYIDHVYQSPGQVHTMINSNSILEVKPNIELKKGDEVKVILI